MELNSANVSDYGGSWMWTSVFSDKNARGVFL